MIRSVRSLSRRAPAWTEVALACAVAAAPIVVATVRALGRGWIPVGDNAWFAIRARDVLTDHHPLTGAWSSGSQAVGFDVSNLGPLQLDLLAPFVRLGGFGPGTAIGVAVLNVAAVVAVVVLVHRRLGPLGAWIGAAMAGALTWSLGSELLYEPRQHHALVLPFLALLVASWAVVAGERWALPVAVALASLVAQTHLTFLLPTAVLVLVVVAGAVWGLRRDRGWRAPVLVSVGIVAIAWVQTLVDELTPDRGNLSTVLRAARADGDSFGIGRGVRVAAQVVAPPDGWWPSAFRALDPTSLTVSTPVAVATLVAVVGGLAVLSRRASRQDDRPVAAWLGLAAVALVAAVLASAAVPVSGPFGAVQGNFRFLWPTAVFATFGLVAALTRCIPAERLAAGRVGVGALAIVLAVVALPSSYQSEGPAADAPRVSSARSLARQVRAADLPAPGPVLVDDEGLYFGEPYRYVVIDALIEDGIEVRFDGGVDVALFGADRRHDGPVAGTVTFGAGDAALEERPGATLIGRAWQLDEQERTRLVELRDEEDRSPAEDRELAELEEVHAKGTIAVWFTASR